MARSVREAKVNATCDSPDEAGDGSVVPGKAAIPMRWCSASYASRANVALSKLGVAERKVL